MLLFFYVSTVLHVRDVLYFCWMKITFTIQQNYFKHEKQELILLKKGTLIWNEKDIIKPIKL